MNPFMAIIVDIGGKYEPTGVIRYYDHHHDNSLPCSLVLVLQNEFPELWQKIQMVRTLQKLIEYIDTRDRFGVARANDALGISDPYNVFQHLPTLLLSEPNAEVGENFVRFIESYARATETTAVYRISDVAVAVAVNYADPKEVPLSVVFEVTGADLAIQRNTRDPSAVSVVKNQWSPLYQKIDLSKLKQVYPVTFLHPNGFLAVIRKTIDAITVDDLKKIVETIL